MAGRPWVLADTTWQAVRQTSYEVALLPWGSTEAHNYHLPYGTDSIQAERVAVECARLAWEAGARVVVLPPVYYGVQTGQLDIPLCMNVNPTTQLTLLGDIVDSVERSGIRKLVIVNGHGGNEFKWMIRELQPSTQVFLSLVNWYTCVDAKPYFAEPGDHAGELETSVVQHLTPELVLPLEEAGPGRERRYALEGLRRGWAWAPRQWTLVTQDTGVGDPRAAAPEKGEQFFTAATQRIAGFISELAAADLNALHEPWPA